MISQESRDLLNNANIKRAGIIPYVKKNNRVLFLFGLDESIACISDFGGTREIFDADVYETALREFHEESFGVLGSLNRKHLLKAPYIVAETGFHGEEGVLFFVLYRSEFPFFSKKREFKERNVPGDETRALIVLSREQVFSGFKYPEERIQSSKIFLFHPKVKAILLCGREIMESL